MMWDLSIEQVEKHPLIVFAGGGSRARRSRLKRFCEWQLQTQEPWYLPDLTSWRDHLIIEVDMKIPFIDDRSEDDFWLDDEMPAAQDIIIGDVQGYVFKV